MSDQARLSPNAREVLERRYLRRDAGGKLAETPDQMFRRVADNVAEADRLYDPAADVRALSDRFFRMMSSLSFLPNSPTLMNAGREMQQLHACYVLPVEDSLESIFDAIKETALIHQSGGGTGFSFSHLRPKGSRVKTTSGVASGPVSFLRVFDAATQAIKQGSFRRGANMGILRVDHPDILDFVRIKRDPQALTNFNLSVAATDKFMEAVAAGAEHELVDPATGRAAAKLPARELFREICESAWAGGDPGLVFLDRINSDNPTPALGPIESTNPCGEQPLLPYESCVLGSINVSGLVRRGASGPELDRERLAALARDAVHFLDNTVDATRYPMPQIEALTKSNRKIGLGIMGFAHLLVRLGIPYASERGLKAAEQVMGVVLEEAREASRLLAGARGPFPNFSRSVFARGPERRNATLTTVAPTGTLSIIANTTSGIEPLFALAYVRQVLEGERLPEADPVFEEVARAGGFWTDAVKKRIGSRGTVQGDPDVPAGVQALFRTAHEIEPEWHLRMQAACQRFTENAISKTINMPASATVADVEKIYRMAWELQCKGITIYRDLSRPAQVLNVGEDRDDA